jgi:hypothetical protein
LAATALAAAMALSVVAIWPAGMPAPPFVVFRTLAPKNAHGRIAVHPLNATDKNERHVTPLSCARVHYSAGAGICIVEEPEGRVVRQIAYTFDAAFMRRHKLPLKGIPVRVRLSPDGRRAGITIYAEEETPDGERLATESIIVDVAAGSVIADLREFALDISGQAPLTGPIDIASVTFHADSDRFFASLLSETRRYLVEGSVNSRALRIVRPGIANEALSADGKRLIAKRRVGERGYWQITIVDLDTWQERDLLQGPRSVDDQVDWLDDAHVLYHDVNDAGTGVWKLAIDGVTAPQLLLADAFSPSVQR